jgi:hypothetical protein
MFLVVEYPSLSVSVQVQLFDSSSFEQDIKNTVNPNKTIILAKKNLFFIYLFV